MTDPYPSTHCHLVLLSITYRLTLNLSLSTALNPSSCDIYIYMYLSLSLDVLFASYISIYPVATAINIPISQHPDPTMNNKFDFTPTYSTR
jgi:hypothetical protein